MKHSDKTKSITNTLLRGKKLDDAIEKELIEMVAEGYERSPISNKNLYVRLINKKIIGGSISTLTTRNELIETYKNKQLEDIGGLYGESLRASNKQSKAKLIEQNAQLRFGIGEIQSQLYENTETLIEIVKAVKRESLISNIERLLSPYLIRELRENSKSYIYRAMSETNKIVIKKN